MILLLKEESKAHYLGKAIQNEVIYLLHQRVKFHNVDVIKKIEIFYHNPPHTSKVKQMARVITCVSINKDADVKIKINESF